jgi:membrane fusion protein (multidrug efflux system)
MRVFALILVVAAGTLLLTSGSAQDGGSQPGKQEGQKPADKVAELQRERIATLKTMAEVEASLYKSGKTAPDAALEARVLVCEAEFDAAEQGADRVTALKGLIAVLTELEETAKASKVAAEGTEAAVLKVKARRLAAEIRLERLQAKQGGQAKNVEREHGKAVVTSLAAKDVVVAEQFTCQIRAQRHIDVRSLQKGYLEEVHVKEGQAVKQGDVMFKMMPLLYAARLEAELAEVEMAMLNLKSSEKLFQKNFLSEDELALSKAKLAGAQAKAKLAQAELELTIIRAPFDGIVDRLQQQQGSLVTESDALTTLSDNSVMWVYFGVPEANYLEYMARPAKDQEVAVELALASGRKFSQPGEIAAIEAQFDAATGTIPFRADFSNPDGLLRHGMTGTVLLRRTLKGAIVVPRRATFEVLGKLCVYVVDKENVPHQREIAIQREVPEGFVVQQGLDANDRIVLEGVRQIHDGEKLEHELRQP